MNMNPKQEAGIPTLFVSGLFQGFTLIMLFISLLYGQQGLVLLSLLILVMFNGALLWCRLSLSGLNGRLIPVRERVFPGEVFVLKAQAVNKKFLPVWLQLNVMVNRLLLPPVPAAAPDDLLSYSPHSAHTAPVDSDQGFLSTQERDQPGSVEAASFPDHPVSGQEVLNGEGGLLWQQQAGWSWDLVAQQRGVFEVGPLQLGAGDLFGFYSQGKNISQKYEIIVYPRLVPLNIFNAPLRELFGAPGTKSPVVDPVYPVATRDYQQGQPARHIHWKASARHWRLQEKVFEPSAQQKILMVVDVEQFRRHKADHAFERTLEVVASLAVHLEGGSRAYGLASNGVLTGEKDLPAFLAPGRGVGQLPRFLEMLARLQVVPGNRIEAVLLQGAGLLRSVTCFYFAYDGAGFVSAQDLFTTFRVPVNTVTVVPPTFSSSSSFLLDELTGEEVAAG